MTAIDNVVFSPAAIAIATPAPAPTIRPTIADITLTNFDLVGFDPAWLKGYETKFTVVNFVSSEGFTLHGTTELFTTFYSLRH